MEVTQAGEAREQKNKSSSTIWAKERTGNDVRCSAGSGDRWMAYAVGGWRRGQWTRWVEKKSNAKKRRRWRWRESARW